MSMVGTDNKSIKFPRRLVIHVSNFGHAHLLFLNVRILRHAARVQAALQQTPVCLEVRMLRRHVEDGHVASHEVVVHPSERAIRVDARPGLEQVSCSLGVVQSDESSPEDVP